MRRPSLLGLLVFLGMTTSSAIALAKPPKPGKCAVASAGVAAESVGSAEWALVASTLLGAALVRRARR